MAGFVDELGDDTGEESNEEQEGQGEHGRDGSPARSAACLEPVHERIEQARDRVLGRINGRAKVGAIPAGNNSFSNPYRPNLLGSCCYKGQNSTAPEYVLRP